MFCHNLSGISYKHITSHHHKKKDIDWHHECIRTILKHEYKYQIKKNLLLAIAIVESGRQTGKTQKWPWPWTICAHKKAYFLRSEQEALEMLQSLKEKGLKNIDVGCMQINIKSHAKELQKMHSVFAIEECVSYAARLLKKLYQNRQQWEKAVAHYHTRTQHLGNAYQQRVFREWNKLNQNPYIAQTHKEIQKELSMEIANTTNTYDAAYMNAYQDAYHKAYEDILAHVQSDIKKTYTRAYNTAYKKAYVQAYKDLRAKASMEDMEIDGLHQLARYYPNNL